MPSLVKILVPCTIGVGGAGLASTNAFIKTNQLVNVDKKDENTWETKLTALLNKLKQKDTNSELDTKIGGTNKAQLALNSDSSSFVNKENAKTALKAWCKNPTPEAKEHFKELCKHEQKRGWLFG